MSAVEETNTAAAAGTGKDTRDGSQFAEGASTQVTARPLPDGLLAQLRKGGLVLPRPPFPGKTWSPSTGAERHLLREGYRLDRVRQQLLAEVGRLRWVYADHAARRRPGAPQVPVSCPLDAEQLAVLAAAAAGENTRDTCRRLLMPYDAIRSRKRRIAAQLGARNTTHAVALAVAAGWITAEQINRGVSS